MEASTNRRRRKRGQISISATTKIVGKGVRVFEPMAQRPGPHDSAKPSHPCKHFFHREARSYRRSSLLLKCARWNIYRRCRSFILPLRFFSFLLSSPSTQGRRHIYTYKYRLFVRFCRGGGGKQKGKDEEPFREKAVTLQSSSQSSWCCSHDVLVSLFDESLPQICPLKSCLGGEQSRAPLYSVLRVVAVLCALVASFDS